MSVEVDGAAALTPTGLWLVEGQRVRVRARGAWSMWEGQWPDAPADGYADGGQFRGCPLGALVGWIGLAYADAKHPVCLGSNSMLVAPRAGYLWLGPNDGVVTDNSGSQQVEIKTHGSPVEVLDSSALRSGPLGSLPPEVVVQGEHVAMLLPTDLVARRGESVADGIDVLDRMYEAEAAVLGARPYRGDRILFVPDGSIDGLGLMIAGNPIRFMPDVLGETEDISLLHLGDPAWSHWSWAHELGHDFTRDVGQGRFMIGGSFVEAWANVPGLAALRALGHPEAVLRHPSHKGWKDGYPESPPASGDLPPEPCTGVPAYLESGTWAQLEADPWLALCMLFELQNEHGADVLERFLRAWTPEEAARWPGHDADPATRWAFFRAEFIEATGADPGPTLLRWHVPVGD